MGVPTTATLLVITSALGIIVGIARLLQQRRSLDDSRPQNSAPTTPASTTMESVLLVTAA
ncbi:hypothetical protein SAMN04489752_2547 [Brevibacterium siliguriense]|uniref:Uncharacterized protein n=1 Tax=Brevibacterium siliguriense TaxID=1136497 RepID=A0A1H1V598_9MICO|nr:hypothetical protein [Brevibacterium siliguriense]SDS79927.1 hypothetical protein SAMN04489752_2547 [Brevibacterium siliguriense]